MEVQEDRNDNIFPRKQRPENKIDAAVALIVAMARAMINPAATWPSVYELMAQQAKLAAEQEERIA